MANHFNTGGITTYLLNLSRALAGKGHHVWVASAGGNCVGLLDPAVRHMDIDIRVKSEVHPKIWASLPRLVGFIKKEGIDILHANTRVTQVMSWAAGKFTSRPFISTCHGFFKPRLFRRLFPCWGSAAIAISKPVQEHLVKDFHVNPARVRWVANGLDIRQFPHLDAGARAQRKKEWNAGAGPIVGIIARLSSVKGIDTLIGIFPRIRQEFAQAQLWIVGQGPEEARLRELTGRLGLQGCVRFESIVNHTAELLPVFDVFVMPSVQEGLGLSVMEAQAAGVPVAAFAVGGLPDLITDGRTGFLAPPGQAEVLAERVKELLRRPQEAQAMAAAARRQVEDNFSLEQMAAGTIQVYEQYSRR